jgi:hypothetical protein
MRIVVGVRPGDVNARQVNADVRHVFTVAECVPPVSARRVSSVNPFDKSWGNLVAHDHDAQDAIVTKQ